MRSCRPIVDVVDVVDVVEDIFNRRGVSVPVSDAFLDAFSEIIKLSCSASAERATMRDWNSIPTVEPEKHTGMSV